MPDATFEQKALRFILAQKTQRFLSADPLIRVSRWWRDCYFSVQKLPSAKEGARMLQKIKVPLIGLLIFLLPLSSVGCRGWKSQSSWSYQQNEEIDALWREGYGYNNPNPQRRREGLEPLNFDGRPDSIENDVKDSIAGAVFSVFVAIFVETGKAIWNEGRRVWGRR